MEWEANFMVKKYGYSSAGGYGQWFDGLTKHPSRRKKRKKIKKNRSIYG